MISLSDNLFISFRCISIDKFNSLHIEEIFINKSDNYKMHVCKKCGLIATVNKKIGLYRCKSCQNLTEFSELRVPYAFKLLSQELETMSIAGRLIT